MVEYTVEITGAGATGVEVPEEVGEGGEDGVEEEGEYTCRTIRMWFWGEMQREITLS